MRKSLVLVLIAIGGGASYAAGVTEVATGPSMDDPSTARTPTRPFSISEFGQRDFTGEADTRGAFAGCVD
jgi:hypothetical protein